MNRRKVTLLICVGLAAILQVIARRYYGSQMHQAFLTLMTYVLVADAVWIFATMSRSGETPLPSNITVASIVRILAIAIVGVGIWLGLKQLGYIY